LRYKLKDKFGDEIRRKFYHHELKPVPRNERGVPKEYHRKSVELKSTSLKFYHSEMRKQITHRME